MAIVDINRFAPIAAGQLGEDVAVVPLDGVKAEVELVGDLAVGGLDR